MPVCAVAITPIADGDVAGHADLAGEGHAVADARAAGDADLAGQHGVAPDRHGVADLHEVVDLGAAPDARLLHGRAVDGRQGADLDVVLDHHDPDLRDLLVAAVLVAREAEAVAADDRAVLHDDAMAQAAALAHVDAGVEHAVLADLDAS